MSTKNRKPRSPIRSPRPRRTKNRSSVSLLPFDPARHLPLLTDWVSRPHFRQWGDSRRLASECRQHPPEQQALIAVNRKPVGYLRWHHVSAGDLHQLGVFGIADNAVEIELCIGDPEQVGQGFGPAALRLLLDRLRQEGELPLASARMSIHNTHAIRAYEHAGFTCVQQYDDARVGRSWVMLAPLRDTPSDRTRRER